MDLHLKDKVAVITGGSKGIGLGIAKAFAREGCHVVITARTAAEVEGAAASIASEFGVTARAVASDVSSAEGCQAIVDAAAKLGGADIFVSNAGTGSNETIANAPDEKWQSYWDLHLMAAVRLSRALADQMEAKGGGAMLMNASICAVQPLWYEPIYNVTKAALLMFGKCLSVEMIKRNIRVNVVNPGLIRTPDWEKTARELAGDGWEGYLQSVADEHADIRRFGSVEELADFCVFICSPRASYSVGSAYHVDGGMLATV
ncbi:SDR family oxidoreductase [Agrobacterium sp. SHOUNA12C]|uniref:Short-chain alcohol dehydrogenase protein n=2 Tax=Rhizobium rhizogenes TaxID=359 RepID=B9JHN0_RHIR8|nr:MULTISPECIES: SDR family oxidoreductase [Rhizobium]ACM29422.1 short-chain alcohol dehydrogenase protein [Rhizobium rhizogenes K84]MCJ9722497.1 SDR family oxidoreductase [Agrobacterium sp. BETTINA12B]MCJ9758320.1 SDR family oxidoreductase [Agrobacterium sp. SHOUNA12C]OCI96125.1 short-chain dehydrogenase [Agrobacterium sp. 13-626]OCJ09814.1 short-chain dehydrogenase [Agrobacterium sp. B131/95]